MRVLKIIALMFMIAATAHAQSTSPAVDFFMHDRSYDTFLRDHYRFEEPKPLRIEYWYTNWLDSGEGADEYKDYLRIEGLFPVYTGRKLIVDVPFQYSRVPIWAETEETTFGSGISVLEPHLMTRWRITDRLKSIIGWEYNLKGDGGDEGNFGKSNGRQICLSKAFFSYDLHTQLSFVAGARFDRYYYDTHEEPDVSLELANRLYCQPAIMMNWHPSDNFIVLLGIPAVGIHLALGDLLKAEARAAVDKKVEIAFRVRPLERISATLRFLNTPYVEIPVKDRSFVEAYSDTTLLAERLCYTDRSILFEIGRELNPAALASLGFRYSTGGDVEFRDGSYRDVVKLDGKPHFAIGVTFTMDIEALAGTQ
jgi:hypothetical protein